MLLSVSKPDFEIGARNYVRGVDYRVLGPVEVLADGARIGLGGPKQRAVVAVLVAAAGRPVLVDTLLQALYGEDASPTQPGDAPDVRVEPSPRARRRDRPSGRRVPPRLPCRDDRRSGVRGCVSDRDGDGGRRPRLPPGCARRWRCGAAIPTPTSRPTATSTARSPASPSFASPRWRRASTPTCGPAGTARWSPSWMP